MRLINADDIQYFGVVPVAYKADIDKLPAVEPQKGCKCEVCRYLIKEPACGTLCKKHGYEPVNVKTDFCSKGKRR